MTESLIHRKFVVQAIRAIGEQDVLAAKFGAVELASRIQEAYERHAVDELIRPYVLGVEDDSVLVNGPVHPVLVPDDIDARLNQEGVERKYFERGLDAVIHSKMLSATYGTGLEGALKIARVIQEFHRAHHIELLIKPYAVSLWECDQLRQSLWERDQLHQRQLNSNL